MDFWSLLSEETPELKKINLFGKKIAELNIKLLNEWNKLKLYN